MKCAEKEHDNVLVAVVFILFNLRLVGRLNVSPSLYFSSSSLLLLSSFLHQCISTAERNSLLLLNLNFYFFPNDLETEVLKGSTGRRWAGRQANEANGWKIKLSEM